MDGPPHAEVLIRELPMQALPVRALPPVEVVELIERGAHATRTLPVFRTRFDLPVRQVVVRVVRTPLAIQVPLEHADLLMRSDDRFAELGKDRPVQADRSDRERANIDPDIASFDGARGLAKGMTPADELGVQPRPAMNPSAHNPDVLDRGPQGIRDDRIGLINASPKCETVPFNMIAAPSDAGLIGLAFEGVELPPPLKPHASGLPEQDAVGGEVCAGTKFLDFVCAQMLGHPSSAAKGSDGNVLERVVAKAHLGAEAPERAGAAPLLRFAGGRHGPCGRPAGIPAETAEAAGRLTQAGVVHIPPDSQSHLHRPQFMRSGPKRDFHDERWSAYLSHGDADAQCNTCSASFDKTRLSLDRLTLWLKFVMAPYGGTTAHEKCLVVASSNAVAAW